MTPGMLHHLQVLHQMRMRELIAEADRERRWRLQDEANGRPIRVSTNPLRSLMARLSAVRARAAGRIYRPASGPTRPDPKRLARGAAVSRR